MGGLPTLPGYVAGQEVAVDGLTSVGQFWFLRTSHGARSDVRWIERFRVHVHPQSLLPDTPARPSYIRSVTGRDEKPASIEVHVAVWHNGWVPLVDITTDRSEGDDDQLARRAATLGHMILRGGDA